MRHASIDFTTNCAKSFRRAGQFDVQDEEINILTSIALRVKRGQNKDEMSWTAFG
jgi:hypothetical protein